MNLLRIHHRSRPHQWSKSGTPQTDRRALQRGQRRIQVRQSVMGDFSAANIMLAFSPLAGIYIVPESQLFDELLRIRIMPSFSSQSPALTKLTP